MVFGNCDFHHGPLGILHRRLALFRSPFNPLTEAQIAGPSEGTGTRHFLANHANLLLPLKRRLPHRRWLRPVVEAEEQRRLRHRFGLGHKLLRLRVAQRRKLPRKVNILLKLVDGVTADDHRAHRPR